MRLLLFVILSFTSVIVGAENTNSFLNKTSIKPLPISSEKEILIIRFGIYRGVIMGMNEAKVRQILAKQNLDIKVRPFKKGRYFSLNGISFRFTEQGKVFQIYALGKDIPIEGGLRLHQSKISDFEELLGLKAKKAVAANGGYHFRIRTNGLEVLLIPKKESPNIVASVMITENRLSSSP